MTRSPALAPRPKRAPRSTAPVAASTWRVTTAVRVFGLAIVVGQVLDQHGLRNVGVMLLGLCVVATAACACELQAPRLRLPWISVAEGLMVGLLIGVAGDPGQTLFVYLAIPAVAAGISGGRMGTANTWLATVVALTAAEFAGHAPGALPGHVGPAVLWLAVGLGAGLLAGHQARTLRRVEAAQAPYAAAHRLVGQLHTLARDLPVVLDVATQAKAIQDVIREISATDRSMVLVRRTDGLEAVSITGGLVPGDEETGRLCAFYGQRLQRTGVVAFPLRVGQHVIGAIVVGGCAPLSAARLDAIQEQLDEHAIRLETALLVEDVRLVATTEERSRLARDIHDGVAQRVVSLGYLADDLAATSADPHARQGAEELRSEITRLVRELRFSVFDLRQEVEGNGGVSAALSEYVRELSSHSDLRVHLTLDERGAQLTRRTETEVLRIAQEAIGNVHKHARAINVWVRLRVLGSEVQLVVEDDGVGGATQRVGHYGMHTMRERADRLGADLEIAPRQDGGTVVTLRSRPAVTNTMGAHHDQRLARR